MTQHLATKQDLEHTSRRLEQSLDQLDRRYRALEQRVECNAVAARKVERDLADEKHERRINLMLAAFAAVGIIWILLLALIDKTRG